MLSGRDEGIAREVDFRKVLATARGVADASFDIPEINGWAAIVVRVAGRPFSVIQLETDGDVIYAVRATLNPDKLSRT